MTAAASAFAGRRVVEVTAGFGVASLAGKLLADLGCPVLKVEPPAGDPLRTARAPGETLALFTLVNATKDSVCIDLAQPEAREPLAALLAGADVLLIDRAHWLRLGDGDALRARHPHLTIAVCSPFGLRGSLAGWQAGEEGVQALSGILTTTGHPGRPPVRVAAAIVTHAAAMYAATSIVADFRAKAASTRGAFLDLAMFDAAISLLTSAFPAYFLSGTSPAGLGNRHSMAAPWNTFRCRDGWVVICAGNEPTWQRLVAAIDRRDLAADPNYATQEARVRHVGALDAEIARWTAERTTREVEATLEPQGIPCGSILPLADVLTHPQFVGRGLLADRDGVATTGGIFHRNGAALPIHAGRWHLGSATRAQLLEHAGVERGHYERWLRDGVIAEAKEARHVAAA